jgi:hypothetical protein
MWIISSDVARCNVSRDKIVYKKINASDVDRDWIPWTYAQYNRLRVQFVPYLEEDKKSLKATIWSSKKSQWRITLFAFAFSPHERKKREKLVMQRKRKVLRYFLPTERSSWASSPSWRFLNHSLGT